LNGLVAAPTRIPQLFGVTILSGEEPNATGQNSVRGSFNAWPPQAT